MRNGIRQRYPNIRFILGHAGGFVPYASHRMAISIFGDTGRNPADSLAELSSFYFDTALSSSAAALPTLMAATADLPGSTYVGPDGPAQMRGYPRIVRAAKPAYDTAMQAALWDVSEKATGISYP